MGSAPARRGDGRHARRRRREGRRADGPAVPAVPAAQFVGRAAADRARIAVLDRTKEPGAVGEPLYLEVVAALAEAMDGDTPPFATAPRVIGGRYGLSSKEFTPSMIKPVFDELAAPPAEAALHGRHLRRRHPPQPADRRPTSSSAPGRRGAGGVLRPRLRRHGRREQGSVKIIGESTDLYAQGYFVYDSKKSGSVTVSHLRFGPEPIRSTYLVEQPTSSPATSSGCSSKMKVLERAKPRCDVPAQQPLRPGRGLGPPAARGAAASSTRRSTSG